MDFTVVWLPDAEQELAAVWLVAPNRDKVTRAAANIDEQLHHGPEDVGESRAEGRRMLIAPPLAATFRVRPLDRIVEVVNVREFRPRTK